ncbi:MAG TPA: bifunctional DNA-formamidopyrimidine glycosylase/DNA-(apurinic or apyrimidinic site) lyase [Rubrivivax sp.]|nr:bifunctional DNA-formamidopyrimidine glycosylase/DNA-(apurinic or apyrimidinic site) lyase [Burkholderiaceae bacterium]HMQ71806.1 bifunctional DNA-formamidopyrimidine glycosylase/DNA-(apurinic or apyrimidinic site) lyase [Rubrivivax sp.]HMR69349.1 bifunctional DNA-formamidopyrimidine glycosylase/DNA-(apurinic or apyrimidinic site) lyase [Rubrivivax sp.]
MPELPEVEVTRRRIAEPLRGATVGGVRLGKPLRWPLGCAPQSLVGLELGAASRRGKYLWLPLLRPQAPGAGDPRPPRDARVVDAEPQPAGCLAEPEARDAGGLLLHLGMSGSLALHAGDDAPASGPHDHFDLVTSRGTLRLTDPRRFGAVVWSASQGSGAAGRLLASLGHEPFDEALTAEFLHAALRRRRAPIKQVLLAGDLVVGAGNIYACEALFAAGIHPGLRADRVSRPRVARLLAALRETMARALELGGSTLRDFRDPHGVDGLFQLETRVYGRAGQPCARCGAPVRRIVQGQRATYYCAHCQRR